MRRIRTEKKTIRQNQIFSYFTENEETFNNFLKAISVRCHWDQYEVLQEVAEIFIFVGNFDPSFLDFFSFKFGRDQRHFRPIYRETTCLYLRKMKAEVFVNLQMKGDYSKKNSNTHTHACLPNLVRQSRIPTFP